MCTNYKSYVVSECVKGIYLYDIRSTPFSMKLTNSFVVSARGISKTCGIRGSVKKAEEIRANKVLKNILFTKYSKN